MNKITLALVRFAAASLLTAAHYIGVIIEETPDGPAREALRDALACVQTGHTALMTAIRLFEEPRPQ